VSHQLPRAKEVYEGYAINTIPTLRSPCMQCRKKNKNKAKEEACLVCKAIEDYQLASIGDEQAVKRCLAFDYPDLGEGVVAKVAKKIPGSDHYHEFYYEKASQVAKEEYGVEFDTLPEILLFLLEKTKNKVLVSKMIGGKPWTIDALTRKYNLPSQKELKKMGK